MQGSRAVSGQDGSSGLLDLSFPHLCNRAAPTPTPPSQFSQVRSLWRGVGWCWDRRGGTPGAPGTHSGRTGRTRSQPRGPRCSRGRCRWAGQYRLQGRLSPGLMESARWLQLAVMEVAEAQAAGVAARMEKSVWGCAPLGLLRMLITCGERAPRQGRQGRRVGPWGTPQRQAGCRGDAGRCRAGLGQTAGVSPLRALQPCDPPFTWLTCLCGEDGWGFVWLSPALGALH